MPGTGPPYHKCSPLVEHGLSAPSGQGGLPLVKIAAAILARAESPAAPHKLLWQRSLTVINGCTVLEWIAKRLAGSTRLDVTTVAVGDAQEDGRIIDAARCLGLTSYCDHPNFILARLLMVARAEQADHVVRVNGNFPLVDIAGLDRLIEGHLARDADFSLNSHYHGLVYGLGVEIFSQKVLEHIVEQSPSPEQQRLGSAVLFQNPHRYRTFFQPSEKTAPHFRVSVDFEPDCQVVSEILQQVPVVDNSSVISFLESRPDLTAAQEITVPGEVSLEKALLFPEKIQSLSLNNCATFDTSYPISVELSLTNRCNHKCIWCSDYDLRERLEGELPVNALTSLFRELKTGGTKGIVIEGGGEPTVYGEFAQVVSQARTTGLAMGLITNGYLMPYGKLMDDFEWVRVSLDAAGRHEYRQLKGVDGFDRVINNLMTMAALRKDTILGVGYVLTNRNDNPMNIEQLVMFLKKIGVNYVHFRPVVDHPELVSRTDLSFLKKYETQAFSVNITAMTDNMGTGNSGLPCLAHSLSTVITADGGVFLCGRLNRHESWPPIGNLHEQSFHEIWTGEKRRNQVRLVSQSEFCSSNCPQCRMTKYNRLLNDMQRIRTRNFI